MADFSILNERQLQVATTLDKNVLLLAPAGTGKTNTLAFRIARIIEAKLALPEEILCMTFTNKACREMRERIERIAGEDGARVVVRTFHSFCYDVIKTETKKKLDLFADFTIFDEKDCESFIRDLADREGLNHDAGKLQGLIAALKEWRAAQALYSADSAADYERALAQMVADAPEKIRRLAIDTQYKFVPALYNDWLARGAAFTALYDRLLQEEHGLDFTDLIVRTRELFRDSDVALKWSRRFAFINIDEVQDTSELEYDILSQIFASNHLLMCGDYFQTIYEWRGTNPERVLQRYQAEHAPVIIALEENYRSTQTLLNASFATLEHLFPDRVSALYPQGLRAASQVSGAPIMLKAAGDVSEEAQWIYYTIQQLPIADYSRICVLTRNNRYNQQLASMLTRLAQYSDTGEGLPFMLLDEQKLFRRQEVKDVLAFLKIIINKHDTPSLVRVLHRFGKGIGQQTIKRLTSDKYRRAGLRLTDFLDVDTRRTGEPFAILMRELAAGNVVVFDVESTGIDTTRDEIVQIAGIRLNADGTVKEQFVRLLHPTRSVGDSERVHKLSDKYLADNGDDPARVLTDFAAFARGAVLVGHNVTYDLKILSSQLARLKLPALDFVTYYDTLDIFRRFYPNLPNHKLEFLGEYCQVSHKSSHDALDDILATAEILMYALKHNIEPGTLERCHLLAGDMEVFTEMADGINELRALAAELHPPQLLTRIIVDRGIDAHYKDRREPQRLENLRHLYRQARDLDDPSLRPLDAIERLLTYTSLSTNDLEAVNKQKIPIITVHQAKGSEFDYVFVAGLQENTFPGYSAVCANKLDEEARLFYVAITRAKLQLFLSWSQFENNHQRQISRFLSAIPRDYIQYA